MVIMIFTLAHYVKYIISNNIYKQPVKLVLVIVMGVMLVISAAALAFINAGVDYHNIMLMGYSIFYIFFVILYERGKDEESKQLCIKFWIILLIAFAVIVNQTVISNVSYHKAQMAYEKSYGVLIRIADRIEQTPDTDKCDTILVVGALDNSSDYSVNLTPDITGITDGYIIREDDETVGQSILCSALNDYCDNNYKFLSGKDKKVFLEKQQVKDMPAWPEKNCISVVDNVIVIKLGTESEQK